MAEPVDSEWLIDDDRDLFTVRSDRLLIVEGDFDWGFLRALLDRHNRNRVQIGIINGKTRYAARVLIRVRTDDADRLRWLGLARDADREQDDPFASMREALRRIRAEKPWFPIPDAPWQRVAGEEGRCASLFVFPPEEVAGDIEQWIWQALGGQPEAPCIDQYVTCLRGIERPLPREWKTRIYSFLAARARPEMPLHAAGRAAELPMDSEHFRRLLDLIPSDEDLP